jgi:hypothetical protein
MWFDSHSSTLEKGKKWPLLRTLLCTIDCIPLLPKNAIVHTKDTGDKHVVGIAR